MARAKLVHDARGMLGRGDDQSRLMRDQSLAEKFRDDPAERFLVLVEPNRVEVSADWRGARQGLTHILQWLLTRA